ncbi:hypothetical protein [Motilibacter aurantiacus]|uniref:hypothetical protein n=1 Tax=Motilibacter aurantiacus TaxID=2714955 RepID=UPI00140750B7|nr:hypothetical protein [Motilibacter aurantiacus]NHC45654.1 hypothetical protein [Motilibacter aurantiacus]
MENMNVFAPSLARDVLPLTDAFWRPGTSVSVCPVLPSLAPAFPADVCPVNDAVRVAGVAAAAAVAVPAVVAPVAGLPVAVMPLAVMPVAQVPFAAAARRAAVVAPAAAKKQAHTYARPRVHGSRAWSPPV